MRHKLYILTAAVSALCVFLISCAHKNEPVSSQINAPLPKSAPSQSTGKNDSRPAQTCPSDSNNPEPSGIANSNNYYYTPPHQTDNNDPALAWVLKGDYQVVKSFYELPKDVRIIILPEPPTDRMAEPNEPFNSTDLIAKDYPSQRFITGGFSEDYAFVFYEHGGRGYNQPFVIVERKSGKANIILLKYFFGENGTMSLDQLKSYLKSGKPPCIVH
jgi:hypothetical protein